MSIGSLSKSFDFVSVESELTTLLALFPELDEFTKKVPPTANTINTIKDKRICSFLSIFGLVGPAGGFTSCVPVIELETLFLFL